MNARRPIDALKGNRTTFAVAQYARLSGRLLRAFTTGATYSCPCCGNVGRFQPHGDPIRRAARCPGCGSLERHRLLALAAERGRFPLEGRRVLHFAPEAPVSAFVAPRAAEYRTADIQRRDVDLVLDLEDIDLPDGSADVVLCSHVLEHVGDDQRAMAELARILAVDGVLVAVVPMIASWPTTYEDPAIVRPADRERHFGQGDHVRYYGADFGARLAATGLVVEELVAEPVDSVEHALIRGEQLFLGTKRAG